MKDNKTIGNIRLFMMRQREHFSWIAFASAIYTTVYITDITIFHAILIAIVFTVYSLADWYLFFPSMQHANSMRNPFFVRLEQRIISIEQSLKTERR